MKNTNSEVKILPIQGNYFGKVFRLEDKICFLGNTPEQSFVLYHQQDCCEDVRIEDITGDLSDLEGTEIVMAEMVATELDHDPYKLAGFTFFKFRTNKGSVTIRFQGESNGYYGVHADCEQLSNLGMYDVRAILNAAAK